MDFAAMTHASAEMLGSIILARLIKVERERNAARADASTFVFMVRELPDTQPPPPVFYDVVAQLSAPKAVAA